MEMAGPPLWPTLLRGLQDAAVLSLLGVLAMRGLLLSPALARRVVPLGWLAVLSGAAAVVLASAWLVAEAGNVAGAQGPVEALTAVPALLAYFPLGRLLLARIVLAGLALALLGWPRVALCCAVAAVAVQPWLGHPAEVGGGLIASELFHMLAAGVWLGGLLPLLLGLRWLSGAEAVPVVRRFSGVAAMAVLVLAVTGPAQATVLLGRFAALAGTAYGHLVLVKSGLFALALAIACVNKFVLTPRLARAGAGMLMVSIGIETGVGCAIVLAAGWLANLPPG